MRKELIVGLTYDLRDDYLKEGFSEEETAEFDRADTVDALEGAIRKLGHQTRRIGRIQALTAALASGKRWDLVFNICEGMYGIAREAQVPALLDAYHIPYVFSDPLVLALTLHKGFTKAVLRDAGVPTPDFHIINNKADINGVRLSYPLFAKPIAEGTGKGIDSLSKINAPPELLDRCSVLLEKYRQPVLLETFLPGREFTVGIVGTGDRARAIGTLEVLLKKNAEANAYSYTNKEQCEDLVIYQLCRGKIADACAELSLRSWRVLGCRDGGRVDVKLDAAGDPMFLEVNPLAGLHPLHSDLPILATQAGISYDQLIGEIVESAVERMEPQISGCL